MAKYTSGRQKNLKIGINSYSENLTSLEVIGNVGIGTTNATSKLTVSGNVNVIGVVTATSFSGSGAGLTSIPAGQLTGALPAIDGSALTGIVASGSGIVIKDDGTPVGTAGTIDFGANLSVSFASGIATITATGAGSTSQWVTTSAGIHTLSNVGIGTTNPTSKLHVFGDVRVSGVITATTFVGALTGTATTAGIATNLKGGVVGNIPYQSAADTTVFLTNGGSGTILQSNGVGNAPTWVTAAPAGAVSGLVIRDSNNSIVGTSGSVSQLTFSTGLSVTGATGAAGIATITLSSNLVGSALSISGISTLGVTSTTNLTSQQLNVSGIATASTFRVGTAVTINSSGIAVVGVVTATSFVGSGANLTGISTGTSITATSTSTIQNLTFTSISSGSTTGLGVSASGLVYKPSTNSLGIGTTNPLGQLQVGSGTSSFIITGIGSVGIGTTNPRAPLDVTSSIRVSAGAASTLDVTIKTYANESGSLSFENSATGASLLTLQQSSGDILFDVSSSPNNPVFKVGIDSSIVVSSGVASSDFKIKAYTNEFGSISFEDAVNATQYFSITQDISTLLFGVNDASYNPVFVVGAGGSVGIGTTNPQKILHVNGGIRNTNRNSASTQTALHINTTTGDIAETASSRRFKRNIKDYEKGLETLMQLRAVSFQFLEDDLPNCGLIAEEVSKIGLSEFVRYDKNGDPYSIPYENLSALYINAIKELKLENDLLKIKIDELIIRINNFGL